MPDILVGASCLGASDSGSMASILARFGLVWSTEASSDRSEQYLGQQTDLKSFQTTDARGPGGRTRLAMGEFRTAGCRTGAVVARSPARLISIPPWTKGAVSSSRVAIKLASEPLRAVPRVPGDVAARTELIAPYPPSDGAALFLTERDSVSLIGSTNIDCSAG